MKKPHGVISSIICGVINPLWGFVNPVSLARNFWIRVHH
jgi:hypothetical protein